MITDKHRLHLIVAGCLAGGSAVSYAQQNENGAMPPKKVRVVVVSSYHREYLWSQNTNRGLCAAMLEFKYFDDEMQAEEYTRNDYVESTKAVVKKLWMDTKRKPGRSDIVQATTRVVTEIDAFRPDVILLGDDNAANYIGNHYIDSKVPIVFWGVNGLPVKYGLLDSIEKPGHNVTGIYQPGYPAECTRYLKELVPTAETFAILSDDSETGRSKAKTVQIRAREGALALRLVETVITNSLSEWKAHALRLQDQVDAFFVVNHNTIHDDEGRPVDQLELGAWYLRNIRKPECSDEKQFADEGMLLVVDDSGFKQAYEAMKTAHAILTQGRKPAETPARAPERGPIIVNRERARMLGVSLVGQSFIEDFVDTSLALAKHPESPEGNK